MAVFPGCAALSCATFSGFGNEIVREQWCDDTRSLNQPSRVARLAMLYAG